MEALNKENIGRILDHVNQRNLSLIKEEVLTVLKMLMRLYDYKPRRQEKPGNVSRTHAKIHRLSKYVSYLDDFWRFKNQFFQWKVDQVPYGKARTLVTALDGIDIDVLKENIPILECILTYFSLVIRYANESQRRLVGCGRFREEEINEVLVVTRIEGQLKYIKDD
jgi:hypothetical protein